MEDLQFGLRLGVCCSFFFGSNFTLSNCIAYFQELYLSARRSS